jgi:subtilisin family serine protease
MKLIALLSLAWRAAAAATSLEFSNTDERVVANIADCVDNWKYYPAWGWNTLAAANATVEDTKNNDYNAHGTHVSGIAAGKNVGMAPRADLYQIRIIGTDGLYAPDDALCAVDTMHEVIFEGHLSDRKW